MCEPWLYVLHAGQYVKRNQYFILIEQVICPCALYMVIGTVSFLQTFSATWGVFSPAAARQNTFRIINNQLGKNIKFCSLFFFFLGGGMGSEWAKCHVKLWTHLGSHIFWDGVVFVKSGRMRPKH